MPQSSTETAAPSGQSAKTPNRSRKHHEANHSAASLMEVDEDGKRRKRPREEEEEGDADESPSERKRRHLERKESKKGEDGNAENESQKKKRKKQLKAATEGDAASPVTKEKGSSGDSATTPAESTPREKSKKKMPKTPKSAKATPKVTKVPPEAEESEEEMELNCQYLDTIVAPKKFSGNQEPQWKFRNDVPAPKWSTERIMFSSKKSFEYLRTLDPKHGGRIWAATIIGETHTWFKTKQEYLKEKLNKIAQISVIRAPTGASDPWMIFSMGKKEEEKFIANGVLANSEKQVTVILLRKLQLGYGNKRIVQVQFEDNSELPKEKWAAFMGHLNEKVEEPVYEKVERWKSRYVPKDTLALLVTLRKTKVGDKEGWAEVNWPMAFSFEGKKGKLLSNNACMLCTGEDHEAVRCPWQPQVEGVWKESFMETFFKGKPLNQWRNTESTTS